VKSKFKTLTAAVAVILGGIGGSFVASPAQAAASDCPDGYFCIWTGAGYTGSRYQYSNSNFLAGTNNGIRLVSGITNRGYSFYDRVGKAVYIIDGPACGSSTWNREMQNGQAASGGDWGGRVSSIQLWNAFPLSC
jgi:hypothetical protein